MTKRHFLYPLIMPAVLSGFQAFVLLVNFILIKIPNFEDIHDIWFIIMIYLYPCILASFAIGLFPLAAFKCGKIISHLDRWSLKLLLSLYSSLAAVVSFFIAFFMIPLWWIIVSLFVWVFLWTFPTALIYKDIEYVEIDADEIRALREKIRENRKSL